MLVAIGIAWNSGSPASNRTGSYGRMIFQFIVNDMEIQSLSMIAVRGWAFPLKAFAGPQTNSRDPAGLVRKRKGVFQVMMPAPKTLPIQLPQTSPAMSNWNSILPGLSLPPHLAVKPTGFLIHQPVWLAMTIGKHR